MMNDCNKTYSTKFNLKRHVEITHQKQKKYKCDLCQKSFVSQQNLKEHIFTHTGAKPYKCPYCDEFFRQISQLSLHRRDHEMKGICLSIESMDSQKTIIQASLAELVIEGVKGFPSVLITNSLT